MKSFLVPALGALIALSCAPRTEQSSDTAATSMTSTGSTIGTADVPSASSVQVVVPVAEEGFFESAMVGGAVGEDGNVQTEVTTFRRNQPIYVTVHANEVPTGLAARVVWFDPKKKEIGMETKPVPVDTKVVTFRAPSTRSWQPGKYRVEIWLGGDQVADEDIVIRK
jgi:hypothetical protein